MRHFDFRRAASLLLSLVLTVALVLPAAAEDEGGGSAPDLSGLTVSLGSSAELILDASSSSLTAAVSGAPENVTPSYSYSWVSSNPAAATVSGSDSTVSILRGGAPGRTDISVTVTATASYTDEAGEARTATATATASRAVLYPGVALSSSAISMEARETRQLTAALYVPAGSDETVVWTSNNEFVAGVSSSGLVTGAAAGSTFITATVGAYSAECSVTVEEVLAENITRSGISADSPLSFSSIVSDIDAQSLRVLKTSASYVTSLSVPTRSGTLYYGYTSEGEPGSGVGINENYYLSGSGGDRPLSDVTFVPRSDASGDASISYTAYNSAGKSFQGTILVSMNAASGITYSTVGRSRVDFNPEDFSAVCRSKTGHELQYIAFSLPSSSKGTLFYNYTGSDLDNKVSSGTAYYYSKSPQLDDVTFVAAEGYSGTVSISYTGRDANGNSFSGSVSIVVSSAAGGKGNINYTTSKNRESEFDVDDFDDLCEDVTGYHLRYVRFTLPSSTIGTLYYNYTSSSSYGSRVSASTSYYRSSSPYLDNVSFVPASGWTGTADVAFTGYATNGQRFTGTVTIEVTSSSSSGSLRYTVKRNAAVRFDVDDFNDYCDDQTGERLNYVRFTLPSSSYGTLRYNYSSSSSTGSAVSASTSYYRSSSLYLDNVYFLAASGYTGTVDVDFTGYSTSGQRFTGTVRITVQDANSGKITYSANQNGSVNFAADDFDDLCEDETNRHLNYIRFTPPASSVGTLRYNYSSSSSTGSTVSASTSYYRSSSPYLSNVSFVPASGYSGTASIDFTGYDTSGQRFTGTVTITVAAPASAGIIYYTAAAGKAFPFTLSAFQNACSARGAGSFTSASFTLPSSSAGQLRYQYVSASEPGSAVTAGSSYSATATPLLSGVSFVPAPGYSGTLTISYTGRDSAGATYSGAVVITVTADSAANSFTDMGNYAWASAAVNYLSANGIVTGTGNGKYSPGASITRGSFMLMLNRAYTFTASPGAGFSDVPDSSVYANAVKVAQSLGIAQGSGSSFYPTRPLSRQQAAVFLARAMRADGWTVSGGTRDDLSVFSDSAAVSDYAVSDLAAMVRLGIFQGSGGKLNPQSPLTRAQMAVILCRAVTL